MKQNLTSKPMSLSPNLRSRPLQIKHDSHLNTPFCLTEADYHFFPCILDKKNVKAPGPRCSFKINEPSDF